MNHEDVFINSPAYAEAHPNSFVIATGGILLEIDKFEVGTEFRQRFARGIIKEIEKDYFITKWDTGYEIEYPLPYRVTQYNNLSLTQDDMYFYEFESRPKKKVIDVEQLQFKF